MDNPVLVEVTRGSLVESRHRGAIAIADADGAIVQAIGDIDRPVFPRSAIKALQALPLLETGAADALGITAEELALCCSSHNGEDGHVHGARAILTKAGMDDGALECGPQPPYHEHDQAILHKTDSSPCPIHNNCSGKHAGFLALASHMGVEPGGYIEAGHQVMSEVRQAQAEMVDYTLSDEASGTDGCSIPTYAMPLKNLAVAFARFGTGAGLEPVRADACRRLYDACVSHPLMVAGTGRFCTNAMALFGGRVFVKTGAEGVFTAAIPELGLGVALKCDDGTTRASEVMMAEVINRLLDDASDVEGFRQLLTPELRNRNDRLVGVVRPVNW
ncbi:asparaginase [Coralliovum pocilloporae]|uniref:asparaginase n=1 Tax=Coralliovum pocilloporae TaxID=3066369 RepID=UPI003307A967